MWGVNELEQVQVIGSKFVVTETAVSICHVVENVISVVWGSLLCYLNKFVFPNRYYEMLVVSLKSVTGINKSMF